MYFLLADSLNQYYRFTRYCTNLIWIEKPEGFSGLSTSLVIMTNKSPKQFYERVRLARLEADLKQEQVARYLKIPVSAVSAFESGNRKIDAWELYRLSRLYRKPLNWFFDEQGASEPSYVSHPLAKIEDPIVRECFYLIENAPKKLQRSAAYGVIGFLSER